MTVPTPASRRSTISLLVLLAVSQLAVYAQSPPVESDDDAAIRKMLANQPDYTATQQFGFMEPKGGFGSSSKVAKLGRRFREENEDTIFITETGKPTIKVYPKRREFAEVPAVKDSANDLDFGVTPEELATRNDVRFRMLGSENVGGYQCRKIEAKYRDERMKNLRFVFFVAPELKNLVVLTQTFLGPVTMTTVLTKVSLGASEALFHVPQAYKKVVEKTSDDQFKELMDTIKASPSPKPI
jgi:hypothetical protein